MNTIREKDFREGWAKWEQKVREFQINELRRSSDTDHHCNSHVIPNNDCPYSKNKVQDVECEPVK